MVSGFFYAIFSVQIIYPLHKTLQVIIGTFP